MNNNKVLLIILATTFSPFLIAAILTSDYFSPHLNQKQHGEFLTTDTYLPAVDESLPALSTKKTMQWQLVIPSAHKNHDVLFKKLSNIKTALGKRSDLVNVLSTKAINILPLMNEQSVYIATPQGQLLLAYSDELVGKPLFKDLKHLLRSNNK